MYNIPGVNSAGTFSRIYRLKIDKLSADPEDASLIDSHLEGSFRDTVPEDVTEKWHPNTNGLGKTTIISPWAPCSSKGSWEMFAMPLSWGHNALGKLNPVSASQPLTGHLLNLDILISIKAGYSKLRVCLIWFWRHPFLCFKNNYLFKELWKTWPESP